jgi:hypothetical protein
MHLLDVATSPVRLPRRTLRAQLAVLYAAVFGLSCVAVAAVAVRTGCAAAAGIPSPPGSCGQHAGLSFAGTIAHDASQNVAGIVVAAVVAVLALGVGWLIAGRVLRPLRTPVSAEMAAREIERWQPVDLADSAGKAILSCQKAAERRDIRIDAALASAPVTGDPALAESLIANLVGNAIQHNIDGGLVEITTGISDGLAVITVSNTGPIVPADEVDRLFQPVQRPGTQLLPQPSGHGIGLATVSAIVSVHGAALTACSRPEGGMDITVNFP